MQDMRKKTYELLHTKPVSAIQYVLGKVTEGFLISLIILGILNLVFWAACVNLYSAEYANDRMCIYYCGTLKIRFQLFLLF